MTRQRKWPAERERAVDLGGRVLPHSEEAERAVLCSELSDPRTVDLVSGILPTGAPFHAPAHGTVHEAILEMRASGKSIDPVTVGEHIRARGHDALAAVGGLAFLSRLVDATPVVAHVEDYATIVADHHRARQVIEACQLGAAEGFGDYGSVQEYADRVESSLYALAHSTGVSSAAESVAAIVARVGDALNDPNALGIPSGFVDVDEITGGYRPGEFYVLAARPGMGKTSRMLATATHVASTPGPDGCVNGVMVFSLEMPKEQLVARAACIRSGVPYPQFLKKDLTPAQRTKLVDALLWLEKLPLWIDDTPGATLMQIRAKVRHRKAEFDRIENGVHVRRLALVQVDYLQLMESDAGSHANSREEAVSEISKGLKKLSRELNLALEALAQLNRGLEGREDKRPKLSDLRESGSIEQDADRVEFIYRHWYYLSKEKKEAASEDVRRTAEHIVEKNRHGATGIAEIQFLDYCMRFSNMPRGYAS